MLEEGHFVGNIKYPMETNATLLNVNMIEFANSLACQQHQAEWRKYKLDHGHSSLAEI